MAVLDESTGNCRAIECAVAPVVWWCVHRGPLLLTWPQTLLVYGDVEGVAFVLGDALSCTPSLGRLAAMVAGQGIGFEDGRGQIIRGPGLGASLANGVAIRAGFQRTNACFNGAIVPRPVGW